MTDHVARHRAALQSFVLRARRIQAHSLAQDIDTLQKLQNPRITVHVARETGALTVTRELPDEEVVESAAARVRPLTLNDEDTYHAKVVNALLYFARKANVSASALESLRELKRQWAAVDPKGKQVGFYEMRVKAPDSTEMRISDNALAFSWIYGDVVHADSSRREEGQVFGVTERFRAAVPIVARLMALSLITLDVVARFHVDGIIPDLGDIFEEEVVASDQEEPMLTKVYVAEYDANSGAPVVPALDEELGDQWRSFVEVFKDRLAGADVPGSERA
ncbi:hypothetical protein MRBLWO14_003144 [Microbacterium sp. LWO14-1.2]|uniref:hypothetical protein n=1 Tax=Microbacterium sp. LWO14-1.2 TaxID=3135263 RepID=UPI003139F9BD